MTRQRLHELIKALRAERMRVDAMILEFRVYQAASVLRRHSGENLGKHSDDQRNTGRKMPRQQRRRATQAALTE